MNKPVLIMLAVAGVAWTTAFADPISPTGNATNDTERIQDAINSGGTVMLAKGTYGIIRAITISNGASLVGGGSAPGDVVLELVSGSSTNAIKIANSASTVVSNLTVTARSNSRSGIVMDSGLVVDCIIRDIITENNRCNGAGVNMSGGTVRRCLITGCDARDSGGAGQRGEGIYMEGGLVENCTVVSNGSTNASYMGSASSGGAIYVKGGVLRNCLIANNWNRVGASGVTARDNSTIENCTIVGNKQNCANATSYGVDISGSGLVLRNNIIWNNTAFDGSVANVCFNNSSSYTFEYNDTMPLFPVGTSNISVDPKFVDEASGDYRPGYTYCTDTGNNQDWMAGAVDLDGNARICNSTVDMGCYEREVASSLVCRMRVTTDGALDLANVTLEWDCSGYSGEGTPSATWTFTRTQDGAVRSEDGASSRVDLQLPTGIWNAHLLIVGDGQMAEAESLGAIDVRASAVYAKASGTATTANFPYDTEEKGTPSIDAAFSLLGDGGTLYVAEGDYVITRGLNLRSGNGSRIVSRVGPAKTIVRIDNASAFNSDEGDYGLNLACDTAYVSGLTLVAGRNGPYYSGAEYSSRGLLKMRADGAVATNCVFRDLKYRERVWGNGLDITKGTVVDCLFTCIESFSSGNAIPQGGIICIQGGLVDRTRIVDCWALDSSSASTAQGGKGDVIAVWGSGTLRNSLVTRCTSEHDTPIYVGTNPSGGNGGHLENCTIVANTNLQAKAKENFWYAAGVVVTNGFVTNCIVADNWSVLGNAVSNIYIAAGVDGIGYTLVDDRAGDATFVTSESHNIAVQPGTRVFRRPERGDYALVTGSPAINSGLKFDWMETACDLAGSPRIISRVPDIGCYEAKPSHFCVRLR